MSNANLVVTKSGKIIDHEILTVYENLRNKHVKAHMFFKS